MIKKAFFKNMLLVAASTLVALALAEAAVRVFHIGPDIGRVSYENFRLSENEILKYELRPGSADGGFSINSDGMRDREFELGKAPGVFRIACAGDSVCYGYGVAQNEAFPKVMEQLLNARPPQGGGRACEVMNFGVTAYNIAQVVENIETRVLDYEPDLIIYAYCLNDAQEYSFEFEALLSELTAAERGFFDHLRIGSRNLLYRFRLAHLVRYLFLSRGLGGAPHESAPDPEMTSYMTGQLHWYYNTLYYSEEHWPNVTRGLANLKAISDRTDISVLVAIIPSLWNLKDYGVSHIHGKVAAAAVAEGLPCVDLLPEFQRYESAIGPVGRDPLHLNVDGNRFAAAALLCSLARRGLAPFDAAEVLKAIPPPHARILAE